LNLDLDLFLLIFLTLTQTLTRRTYLNTKPCVLIIRFLSVFDMLNITLCMRTWREVRSFRIIFPPCLPRYVPGDFSRPRKFLRNIECIPKIYRHVLSSSKKHSTETLVKSFDECCMRTVLTVVCYWTSRQDISAQKFVSLSAELIATL